MKSRSRTPSSELARIARRAALRASSNGSGFESYRDRPVAFAEECLGMRPWSHQRTFLEAVAESDRVAWRSGHHVGKTEALAAAALWWAATREGARAVLLASSFAQLSEAVWRSVRHLYSRAKVKLGGTLGQRPQTGLRYDDGRQVIGLSPDDEFRLQGLAAPALAFFVDEASVVPDGNFEVMLGCLAGGGKLALAGNPNRAMGPFFDAFRSERFVRLHTSALDSPNVTGEASIPGLATEEWITERMSDWQGPDGPIFKIRVLGEFVEVAQGRVYTPEIIAEAEKRYASTEPSGRLVVGVDCAGESGEGDDSVFCSRRGKKVLRLHATRGLTADAHVATTLGIIREDRGDSGARPQVNVDYAGKIGADVYNAFRAHLRDHEGAFVLTGIRGGERAHRRPMEIYSWRDECFFALLDWLRDGGAIPEDLKLQGELAAIVTDDQTRGLAKIIGKEQLRKELGRSPDRADALALSMWELHEWAPAEPTQAQRAAVRDPHRRAETVFDPYRALDAYRQRPRR